MEEVKNTNGTSFEPKKKGKGKVTLLIIFLLLIVVVIAGLTYYFTVFTKTDVVYKRLIGVSAAKISSEIQNSDYKTLNSTVNLNAKIEPEGDMVDEEVLDIINSTDFNLNVQTNNEQKQLIANLEANNDGDSLIKAKAYSNVEEQKTYIYLENLLDKYIEIEADDEYYTSLSDLLESQKSSTNEKIAMTKIVKVLKTELTGMIKEEYCSNKKENDGTIKNTIKMTAEQLNKELQTIVSDLKQNEEFLSCFEDREKQEKALEQILENLEDANEEDYTVELNVYTKGIMQTPEKAIFNIYNDENEVVYSVTITKTGEDSFSIETNIEDLGKITLNIAAKTTHDEDIENIEIEKSVKADELTGEDQNKLMKNFTESKLYEVIGSFMGGNLSEENTLNINTGSTDVKENEIVSYDNKCKIKFNIPEGYDVNAISNNSKTLSKNETLVKVATTSATKDEYYKDLMKTLEEYEEDGDYENIKITKMKNVDVNGRTFYYATYSYTKGETKFTERDIWSEISEDYVVEIQIKEPAGMTGDELSQILTMEVTENN